MIGTLLKSVREYKRPALLTPLFMTFEVILECILPLVMAMLIDSLGDGTMKPVLRYGALLVFMALLSLFCGTMSGRFGATASCGFAKNLRQDLFFRIQDFGFSDIDYFSTGSLVTRMTTDVTNVQNAFQMIIRIAVRTPMMIIFSIIMSCSVNVKMAMIFIILLPIITTAIIGISRIVMPIFRRIFRKYDAMNSSVQENVAGIRVVKSFVREEYETEKFTQTSGEVCSDFTHVERILGILEPTMMFGIYVAMLLVSVLGARMIVNSGATELTAGELSSLITYGVQILSAVMMLGMIFVMTTMAQESAGRIAEVLNFESTLRTPEDGSKEVRDGSVDFDHVSFKYRPDAKEAALKDIDLHIPSGATIGIIGGTGSSKSTLIQLIPRLYDVTEGAVRVGGLDVRSYDLKSLRDAVSVVLQKNVLFSGTISENIRWGKKDATDEEVRRVCELACADEFIRQFPDGYDTMITQGGTNVSGGQKQRLCIARALLKKPRVLILDDSTSAVDTKTDAQIRRAFRTEIPDTTKIIIAQRTSSVADADLILVMEGGGIAERGTHEELMELGGIYSELVRSQNKEA